MELRQSQKKISTLKRKSQPPVKPPPRPTPGSITYTDDESDKAYDNNPDESSLTEKPSEISSTTDSQVRNKSVLKDNGISPHLITTLKSQSTKLLNKLVHPKNKVPHQILKNGDLEHSKTISTGNNFKIREKGFPYFTKSAHKNRVAPLS